MFRSPPLPACPPPPSLLLPPPPPPGSLLQLLLLLAVRVRFPFRAAFSFRSLSPSISRLGIDVLHRCDRAERKDQRGECEEGKRSTVSKGKRSPDYHLSTKRVARTVKSVSPEALHREPVKLVVRRYRALIDRSVRDRAACNCRSRSDVRREGDEEEDLGMTPRRAPSPTLTRSLGLPREFGAERLEAAPFSPPAPPSLLPVSFSS